jgi:predicted transcriptional regulator
LRHRLIRENARRGAGGIGLTIAEQHYLVGVSEGAPEIAFGSIGQSLVGATQRRQVLGRIVRVVLDDDSHVLASVLRRRKAGPPQRPTNSGSSSEKKAS